MKGGVCTNCLRHGDHQACSFRRKFLTIFRTCSSLLLALLLTCSCRH
jgi:hypothetical protein